jgi:hypothetical protein
MFGASVKCLLNNVLGRICLLRFFKYNKLKMSKTIFFQMAPCIYYCTLDFQIRLYKPYIVQKLVKKAFHQCNNKYGVPFEKNEFLTFLFRYV